MRGLPPERSDPTTPAGDPAALAADQLLLKESLGLVAPSATALVSHFYDLLFRSRPALRHLFPEVMEPQRDRLLAALLSLVDRYDQPDQLEPLLRQLGRDHRKFGVMPGFYEPVGRALIETLRQFAGSAWTPSYEQAWLRAYQRAAAIMIQAADEDAAGPPYWYATVVGHERRRPDLAVLQVRPAEPYPYLAGQYATVESPRVPRAWRPYSMATAPRPDGLLEFHVRQVEDGSVSRALVHEVGVGDRLRLGPPMGATVLAPDAGRDLLLFAGGTGLAPMRALAEAAIGDHTHHPHRRVRLVYGARDQADLYDLPALAALQSRTPQLSLYVAVASGPVPAMGRVWSMAGRLPDVFGRFADVAGIADLAAQDILAAGPPTMVRAILRRLADLGVTGVRHDPIPSGPG